MNEQTIIAIPGDRYKTIHPTQKPVELLKRLLSVVLQKKGIVLDSFAGSGSTGIACIELGHGYLLNELDPEYCKKAELRLLNAEAEALL
jgi:site-specific DNA-methyltransferase (adenine-specific)